MKVAQILSVILCKVLRNLVFLCSFADENLKKRSELYAMSVIDCTQAFRYF